MRFEATRKTDLAVRALIALADTEDRLKGAQLAERLSATAAFMSHVMSPLVKNQWVASDPGRNGGYRLLVELDQVSVLQVAEALEGPLDSGRCVVADLLCDENDPCALHTAWTNARDTMTKELAATTITQIAATIGPGDKGKGQ